ncbi:MAG: nucleotidyltransferase domain-containing protein [Myxococcales bacterium]|nr:nucleotidyltransferase domain-containing protein [Myxococcales bacterium]
MTVTAVWPGEALPLPAPTKTQLEKLSQQLQTMLQDNLVSLAVHGSVARGEYRPGSSDVDLIIVLESLSVPLLTELRQPLRLARDAARIESMLLLRGEIARSADVFPLFYDEIAACHVVLAGRPPLEGVDVSDEHLRLRIEQELREINTRLRRLTIDAMEQGRFFVNALEHKLRQVRYPLLALLRLRGLTVPDTKLRTVLAAATRRWPAPLDALTHVSDNPSGALEALFTLLGHAIEDVDRTDP